MSQILSSHQGHGKISIVASLSDSAVESGRRPKQPCVLRSGEWAGWPGAADYRWATIGDMLVERLVWGQDEAQIVPASDLPVAVTGPHYIWFRFWLPDYEQVVEKYFDQQGKELGMLVNVCAPLVAGADGYWTRDLLLDIWIAPDGRVTVRNEAAFEQAVRQGVLTVNEAAWAEAHIRELTAAIAQGRFPPPIVRRWQVDLDRVREALSER